MNVLLSGSSHCIPGSCPISLLFFYLFYFLVLVLIYCDLKFLLKDKLTTFWRSTMVIIAFAHCVLISLAYGNINHFFVKRKFKKKTSSSYLEPCDIRLLTVTTSCEIEHSWTVTWHLLQCLPLFPWLWVTTLLSAICYCFACMGPYSI